ncbi:MAG: alanine--tRNA ligase [Deltaproteobacteria bacterium]|nr:MAG: alanine--tRNA ligase [Deltaproteobacteria bacterium]
MTPDELRQSFLTFFHERQHEIVVSSPVVPEGDPTLLFTNAGMNQFKDVLLGLEKRDYRRATSVQKCIRAGGKHNDLDEVGKDGRHLTFFEMLGNWSFGDYYKREAIQWAWEYVTATLGLSRDRLYVSVYLDDDESWDFWHREVGLPPDRIVRLGNVQEGDEENFWSMGPTGPCGPCTEIYYDQYGDARPPEPWQPGFDEDRFIEIWNIVFMEFDRDSSGTFSPLPMKSVDTGMGLERVAAILEGVDSVFSTAIFAPLLEHIHHMRTGEALEARDVLALPDATSYCVIADHIRTLTFCVSEGAQFANDGRGYVLRRILRRAVRFGRTLGFDAPFLHEVSTALVEQFGQAWPELRLKQREAAEVLRQEEERFFRTLDRGIALFEEVATATQERNEDLIDGESVFRLYDTFGFPPDLTRIMAEERSLDIDEEGYERAMARQRERSRGADDRYASAGEWHILREGMADTFTGHVSSRETTEVLRYRVDEETDVIEITLLRTPFYAESGGQVGDRGMLSTADASVRLEVFDTRRTTAGITHFARVSEGDLTPDGLRNGVVAEVDPAHRFLTSCNHTATHLLHAALHRFVSPTAFQAGSLVAPDRLRFDFNHDRPVPPETLETIERWVNDRVREGTSVLVHEDVALADAEAAGAMMIFGEKYGDRVRMVEIPGHSTELCGGIHAESTRDIGWFRIVSEGGVAAGVRRIEAVTNEAAFRRAREERAILDELQGLLRVPDDSLVSRVRALQTDRSELERKLSSITSSMAANAAAEMASEGQMVGEVRAISRLVEADSRDTLLGMADELRSRLSGPAAVLLAAVIDDKPALLVQVTEDGHADHGLHAGKLINLVAAHVGGRGGGRPTLAQAGGQDVGGLESAVSGFPDAVAGMLSGR